MGSHIAPSSESYYLAKFKRSKVSDGFCYQKVECKERRIRLSAECAKRVFELNKVLGHRSTNETIEWLLKQAKPAIDVILGTGQLAISLDPPAFANIGSFAPPAVVAFPTPTPCISIGETLPAINPRASDELEGGVEFFADEIAKILFQNH